MRDQAEALVVRGLLEAHGIEVLLRSQVAPTVYPFSVGEQGPSGSWSAARRWPRAVASSVGIASERATVRRVLRWPVQGPIALREQRRRTG